MNPGFEPGPVAIIGLGYVGLPLAVAFGAQREVVGFDINKKRIDELRAGRASTLEVEAEELAAASQLSFTADPADLTRCSIYIVTVPTPIDHAKRPDLRPLELASKLVGEHLSEGNVVIFESTVFPGCVSNFCVPILEQVSGLGHNDQFFTGYSPERINPGDKQHRLPSILKVTSGSTPEVADAVDAMYSAIITAGTFKAASIEVAEAAKVIENTQRDLNIALMNELAIIFDRLDIDTQDVLAAAATKWNFLPFKPGLVGGHCIGVDPYYLTHRAQEVGYHPEVILAGRRINDSMAAHVAERIVKLMLARNSPVAGARILIMGLAFKEDCPDLRNTKVADLVHELQAYSASTEIWDPWVDAEEARAEYGIDILPQQPDDGSYDAVVIAVAHRQFAELGASAIRQFGKAGAVLFDIKGMLERDQSDGRL